MKKYFNYKTLIIAVLVFAGVYALNFLSKDIPEEVKTEAHQEIDSTELAPVNLKYGFPIDDFEHEEGKVKRNQSLSTILRQYDVSYAAIDKIAKKAKKSF
jgi:hypothetical protein